MRSRLFPVLLPRRLVRQPRGFAGVLGLALGSIALTWSSDSDAHFTLISPPSWVEEDVFGNPQKLGPCGGTNVTETETVTSYRAGSMLKVQWKETVGHPGHFRISLARDRDDLVVPAVETTTGDGLTGFSISAAIMDPPVYPVLLDGIFAREGVLNAEVEPFSVDVQLPAETCDDCTLQVIQFMANHEPGFFYYHCADIRIVAADAVLPEVTSGAGGSTAQSSEAGAGSGASADGAEESGGCTLTSGPRPFSARGVALFLGLGVALWRRRSS
jgi:hypothetical protein